MLRALSVIVFFVGALVGLEAQAQTALNLASNTPSADSGTGWVAVNNSTANKTFIDAYTYKKITETGTTGSNIPAYLNLVGGTYSGSGAPTASAVYSDNPMLQIQTGYIGGTTANDLGIAFRVRLGAYDPTKTFTGVVGINYSVANQTNGTDAASFAAAATVVSNGTTYTSYSVSLLWNTTSGTVNKPDNFNVSAQGFNTSVGLSSHSGNFASGSTNSSFVSIQATTDVFSNGTTPANDAWLSFGVTFAAVNANVAAIARNSLPFDATTSRWSFTAVPATGTTPATFAGQDAVGSNGNIYMSDFLYTNGSSTSGSTPTFTPVPEPSTFLMVPALLAPAVMVLRRRRRLAEVA
jgi:hypothetical protein